MEDPPTPTEDDEASSVPTVYVLTGPDDPFLLSAGNRKAAKRTFPFDLKIGETIQLVLPPPPRKKQRLGEPLSTSIDEASTENISHDTTIAPPPPDAAAAAAASDHATDHADSDPVMDSRIDPAAARTGLWGADEDKQLKDAVREHGTKNWKAIAALVPGRTQKQCSTRWHNAFVSNINPTTASKSKRWTADEDKQLKDAVREHGAKDWIAIATLVPGRTKTQCYTRWHNAFVSTIDPAAARTGKWTADENKMLKDAVREHGAKDWIAIAALIPGRTKNLCRSRWHNALASNIDATTARAGRWTADEDETLREAVGAHGGKNWKAISAQIPGRTKIQCRSRWREASVCNIDPVTARAVKWTADEDKKLKDAFRAHGGKNWKDIALLVPGRTCKQCRNRWFNFLGSLYQADERTYG
jgi:uncharacterized protein (DUF2237 family)